MFLVYEKQVLSLEDDSSKLGLYFLEKHQDRMKRELHAYKAKMNFSENPNCWKVYTSCKKILYVYTENKLQARTYAITMKYEPLKVLYVHNDEVMTVNNTNVTIGSLVEGKRKPSLL